MRRAKRQRDGTPFYSMLYVDGQTLEKKMEAVRTPADRLSLLAPFVQVCQAVGYAHARRVVHRDLKPANVMLGRFGRAFVLDWGLARALGVAEPGTDVLEPVDGGDPSRTGAGVGMGTPRYMSPEQARGGVSEAGPPSAVWSLGIVLWEILAGRNPYAGLPTEEVPTRVRAGEVPELPADVPPELAAITRRALLPHPADRYPDAERLAAEVDRWRSGELVQAFHSRPAHLVRRWVQRHRPALGVLGLTMLVGSGTAGLGYSQLQWEHQVRASGDAAQRAHAAGRPLEALHALRSALRLGADDPRLLALGQVLLDSDPLPERHSPGDPQVPPVLTELVGGASSVVSPEGELRWERGGLSFPRTGWSSPASPGRRPTGPWAWGSAPGWSSPSSSPGVTWAGSRGWRRPSRSPRTIVGSRPAKARTCGSSTSRGARSIAGSRARAPGSPR